MTHFDNFNLYLQFQRGQGSNPSHSKFHYFYITHPMGYVKIITNSTDLISEAVVLSVPRGCQNPVALLLSLSTQVYRAIALLFALQSGMPLNSFIRWCLLRCGNYMHIFSPVQYETAFSDGDYGACAISFIACYLNEN